MVAATGKVSEDIVSKLENGTYPPQNSAGRPSMVDMRLTLVLEVMLAMLLFGLS